MSRTTLRIAAVKVLSDDEFREIVSNEKMKEAVMKDFELDEKETDALIRLARGESAEKALIGFFNQAVPY